ncbi:VanZ family protein [Neobacillus sp. 19]|uniref:VanZ family protein n=1 Tax=Neobacillus sp. 19 TaxID=3394458 RepID=UPI003BF70ACB
MKNKSLWLSIGLSQLIFMALFPIWLRLLSYLHPIVLAVVWLCVTILVFFVVYFARKETIHISKTIIISIVIVYSFGLLVLLFFRPSNQEYSQINLVPFKTIAGFLSGNGNFLVAFYNITANVLLFVPFGVVTLLLSKNPLRPKLFFISGLIILLIETTQHLTKRGSMDIDDMILNLLGVWIGYVLYPAIHKVVRVKGA